MPSPIEQPAELQHIHMAVNKATIRSEMVNNRLHIVIPSYTLPSNVVMNGLLYPHAEIEANYKQLEDTLAPIGHPVVNGQHVSANSPEAIAAYHAGVFNRNVQRRGDRIFLEKFVDVEYATNSAKGRQLLEAIGYDAESQTLTPTNTPIHSSVAAYVATELTPNAEGYRGIARITKFDHDAVLLGEPGAATPEQGVGLLVNAAEAVSLQANAGVLGDEGYNYRRDVLTEAARKRYGEESWVQDFGLSTAIVRMDGGESKAVVYTLSGGKAEFADESTPVKREDSWVVNQINRICQSLGLAVHSQASTPETEQPSPEADPMDKDEIAAMLQQQAETLAANMAEMIKPLGERLEGLEANLQANADAAIKPKREAVAKVIGELAANKLSGAELDEAFGKLQSAAPLLPGFQANASETPTGAPAADEYFNNK